MNVFPFYLSFKFFIMILFIVFTSLHFTSLHFTSLHFTSLFPVVLCRRILEIGVQCSEGFHVKRVMGGGAKLLTRVRDNIIVAEGNVNIRRRPRRTTGEGEGEGEGRLVNTLLYKSKNTQRMLFIKDIPTKFYIL